MDADGLLDDKAILLELPDVLAGVGVGNFADLVGVQPNLVFATFHDTRRKALLEL